MDHLSTHSTTVQRVPPYVLRIHVLMLLDCLEIPTIWIRCWAQVSFHSGVLPSSSSFFLFFPHNSPYIMASHIEYNIQNEFWLCVLDTVLALKEVLDLICCLFNFLFSALGPHGVYGQVKPQHSFKSVSYGWSDFEIGYYFCFSALRPT